MSVPRTPRRALGPSRSRASRRLFLLGCLAVALMGSTCPDTDPEGFPLFFFQDPAPGLLTLDGDPTPTSVRLRFPFFAALAETTIEVDGVPTLAIRDGSLQVDGRSLVGTLPDLGPGRHQLVAHSVVRFLTYSFGIRTETWLESAALDRPEDCEILNGVECLLPFPSSRYLEPAATPTGHRVVYPDQVLPDFPTPLDSAAFGGQDGFSPGVQVLMHFPGGVDVAQSGASRLLASTRTHDSSSLGPDSPTLLLDATEGMVPVLHWVETDARATGPARQVLFLRPAETLKPGHRYVVAVRGLVHGDGSPIEPEPPFAALRDGRASTIPALEARRPDTEALFGELAAIGVARDDLQLAFDFVVQSEEGLTRELLAMRDRAFEWLAQQPAGSGVDVFDFLPAGASEPADGNRSLEFDCSVPGQRTWRELRGTYQSPLFLSADPLLAPKTGGRLVDEDGDGLPEIQGTMAADFSVTIPCIVLQEPVDPVLPILTGHGLFGNGRQIVGIPQFIGAIEIGNGGPDFPRISGATSWLGLSSNDLDFLSNPVDNFIVQAVLLDPDNFGTLPDRLRQGVTNALVLGRMMKEGFFNAHPEFQLPASVGAGAGTGVFPGAAFPLDYAGISLGGIMGTIVAATSPDVDRFALDVPAANFSILIQRSLAISLIEIILNTQNPDAMSQALFLGMAEELWDSAEPVGYLRNVTRDPLPGSGAPKDLLYTVGEHDGIVANTASAIAIRTLGLPNLFDGSLPAGSSVSGQPGIPDVASVSESDPGFVGASIWYDLGAYGDPIEPALLGFVPPLANDVASSSCDPHGATFQTGAEARQIASFLRDGVIESFCDGICDGRTSAGDPNPFELQGGATDICDPTS